MTQESEPVDGGDGLAVVDLDAEDAEVLQQMAARTQSNPTVDPMTGAELGMGVQPDGADFDDTPAGLKNPLP